MLVNCSGSGASKKLRLVNCRVLEACKNCACELQCFGKPAKNCGCELQHFGKPYDYNRVAALVGEGAATIEY